MMVIASIPSVVPDWFDPSAPDFKVPDSWAGTTVRVKVPITSSDPAKDMREARVLLEEKYPGATLRLVEDFDASYAPSDPGAGTDEDMLAAYFATQQMPPGSTADQAVAYLKTLLPDTGLFGVQGVAFGVTSAVNALCFERTSIDMSRPGLTLVTGARTDKGGKSNGAGKSSWVGLPFLALTGETFKKQEHDEWACDANGLPAEVDSSCVLPDGRSLRVWRQRRPSKLRAWVAGREETMATPAATQKHIERLTNLTWDVLTNAVYIGQRETTASAFGTDKERKELFSELLGLNRFLDAQAKARRASIRLQREADTIATEAASAEASLAEASRGREELAHSVQAAPKVDKSEVSKLNAAVVALQKRVGKYLGQREKFGVEHRGLAEELRGHENGASVARGEHNALRRQYEESSQAKGRCRLCGGVIAAANIDKYRAELKRGMDALDKTIKDKNAAADAIRARCAVTTNDINLVDDELARLDAALNAAETRLGEIQMESASVAEVKKSLAAKDARIRKWRKVKSVHERARAAVLDVRAFVDVCAAACGRDGMPAFLCAASVPRLNSASAVYADAFESDVKVVFKAESDGVGIEVVNEDGGGTYKAQSKGESSMAGIITALSFREALVPLGVLILDEPGEGLDEQNAAAFARGMNKVASRFGSAYVITHNPNILGSLEPDHHVELVKTGKFSEAREVV